MNCKISNRLIGRSDWSIKELDEYCQMTNKRVFLDGFGRMFFSTGYFVGERL